MIDECPAHVWTSFGVAPAAIHRDTAVWRRSWIRSRPRVDRPEGGIPESIAKVRHTDGPSFRCLEHQVITRRVGRDHRRHFLSYEAWKWHDPMRGLRLQERLEVQVPADVDQLLSDLNLRAKGIKSSSAKSEQLTQSQARIGREQSPRPKSVVQNVEQSRDLVGSQHAHLVPLDLGQLQALRRIGSQTLGFHCRSQEPAELPHRLADRLRREPATPGGAPVVHSAMATLSIRASGVDPNRGRTWTRRSFAGPGLALRAPGVRSSDPSSAPPSRPASGGRQLGPRTDPRPSRPRLSGSSAPRRHGA